MKNSNIEIDVALIDKYNELAQKQNFKQIDDDHNKSYIKLRTLKELSQFNYASDEICDMLVKYLFCIKKSKHKNLFWLCFEDFVYENLSRNIKDGFVQCKKCGKRFYQNKQNNLEYCNKCGKYQPIVSKVIKCIDCGKEVEVEGIVKNKKRCDYCQKLYDNLRNRQRVRNHRIKNKL